MKATDIRAALRQHYLLPEWCLMFEVASAAGNRSKRFADALAIDLVATRGLSLHGFEIKVSRQDLKTELNDADKSDAMARYCDNWWLVTPKGLCTVAELPLSWGLIEVDDDGLRHVRPAQAMQADKYDRAFIAALARRIHRQDEEHIHEQAEARLKQLRRKIELMEQNYEQEVERRVQSRLQQYVKLQNDIAAFERVSGLSIHNHWQAAAYGPPAALVHKAGLLGSRGLISTLKQELMTAAERVAKLENELQAIIEDDRKAG